MTLQALQIVADPEPAAALLSALRIRILAALRKPNSAAGIASELGVPRQKLNYHIKQLETHGLLKAVGTRQARGFTEQLVQSTAAAYLIDASALGSVRADPAAIQDQASSAYLASTAASVISDVARLRARADVSGERVATMTLHSEVRFASSDDQRAFAERLTACLSELIATYHTDGGRPFRLLAGVYQSPEETLSHDETT